MTSQEKEAFETHFGKLTPIDNETNSEVKE
jgi:hypothetical protein